MSCGKQPEYLIGFDRFYSLSVSSFTIRLPCCFFLVENERYAISILVFSTQTYTPSHSKPIRRQKTSYAGLFMTSKKEMRVMINPTQVVLLSVSSRPYAKFTKHHCHKIGSHQSRKGCSNLVKNQYFWPATAVRLKCCETKPCKFDLQNTYKYNIYNQILVIFKLLNRDFFT